MGPDACAHRSTISLGVNFRHIRRPRQGYIAAEHGTVYLANIKNQAELRAVKKEIAVTSKMLMLLQARKVEAVLAGTEKPPALD